MKRNYLASAGALAIAGVLALSGCGRSDAPATTESGGGAEVPSGEAEGTVTVWAMGNEGEILGQFAKQFEDENPGVKVEVTPIPWDSAQQKLQTSIAGGTVPDISGMGTTWMTDFADAFAPVPANFDTSDMFEGSLGTATINGELVGVPWYVDTRVLFYRTDIAEQAGWDHAPKDWSELHQMAADMKDKAGVEYPVRMPGREFDSFQGSLWMLWSAGGDLLNEDRTEWTIDTPEANAAYEYLNSFYQDGLANPQADVQGGANSAEFVAGTSPVLVEGPYMLSQIEQAGAEEGTYATAVLPKDKTSTSFTGGVNMTVFKEAKNPDGAWKFIEWLSQPEVQVKWFELSGTLPSTHAAWDDSTLSGDENLKAFGDQLADTMSPPTVGKWTEVALEGDSFIEKLALGSVTPAEGLAALQQKADSIGVE